MSLLTLKGWLGTDDKACADIVRRKYLLDEDILGHEETVDEFLDRISMGNEKVRELILKRRFIPGGRILAGMGLEKYGRKISYSNCYVLNPPQDSIRSISDTYGDEGETFSRGGGCGFDISNLAPKGAKVNNSSKTSTGAVSFIPAFSDVATRIGQNGRRGALLLSIKDTHPDLEEFITLKKDLEIANSTNLSVMVSDKFIEAVQDDSDWELSFYRGETNENITKVVKAKDIMRLISQMNWEMGEPGMLFWDNFKKYNLMSADPSFEYAGTNPCGEEPLPAGGACLLGAMNLSEYYDSAKGVGVFKTMQFAEDVRTAIEYLDNVLTAGIDLHPLQYQRDAAMDYRQIGLGVMGLADLFIKNKYRYGSAESTLLLQQIGYTMAFEAIKASAELAKSKSMFPRCNPEKILESSFIEKNVIGNPLYNREQKGEVLSLIRNYGLRNSALLTCAPTGTISTIFNVSGGIEPLFALEYERTTKTVYGEEKSYIAHPAVIQNWLKDNNYNSLQDAEFPSYIVSARDISWRDRINVQATLQKHIDASISSTINLPENTTVEEIEELYLYAHDRGCKGITVFRENCDREPILKDTTQKEEAANGHVNMIHCQKGDITDILPLDSPLAYDQSNSNNDYKVAHDLTHNNISVPIGTENKKKMLTRADFGDKLPGTTYYKKVACGHIYITVNRYNGMPVEVFMESSKSGGCSANTEALGRMASTMLRSGVDVDDIVDTIIGIKCAACATLKGKGEDISGLSCSDVMAKVLKEEYETCMEYNKMRTYQEHEKSKALTNINPDTIKYNYKDYSPQENIDRKICPECGNNLILSEGCIKCMNCGFSKC